MKRKGGCLAGCRLVASRRRPSRLAPITSIALGPLPTSACRDPSAAPCCHQASDASGTGLFDPTTRGWDRRRIEQLDSERLPGCLPGLVGPQEAVGTLRAEAAAALGLPEGVQVAPGGGDNAMAALGSGAVREGTLILSLGTSGALHCCCMLAAGWWPCPVAARWLLGGPRKSADDVPRPAHPPHPRCAGTLFGPSAKPVLDPTGVICPFAGATGAWLPLL